MQKIIYLCFFIILFTFFQNVLAIKSSQTQISTNRNPYRNTICEFYSRNFTQDEKDSSQSLIDSYNYLSDGEIQTIIYQKNLSPSFVTIIIIAPHVISLIVLCFLWPALCCCCVKPQKFPLCQKCRKPQKQMYTKIELKWTGYVFIIFSLLIVIGSLIALFQSSNITHQYNNAACRLIAIFDDLQNGRVSPTNQDRFFVGLTPLTSQMVTFKSQISTFYSDSNTSLNTSSNIRTKQATVQSLITNQYNIYVNTVYSNAFTSDGTTYVNVNSAFKDMYYGPISNTNSILGKINSHEAAIFNQVNTAIDPMIAAWGRIQPKGQTGLSAQAVSAKNSFNSTALTYDKIINQTLAPAFDYTSSYNSINIALKVFYAIILVLSLLMTVSALILTLCSVIKIRLVIYCTCGFLAFLGFFCFFMMIFFAYAQPVVTQICGYSDAQLSSGSTAKSFFQNIGFSQVGNYLQQCMADGNGRIVGSISPIFQQSFDDILTISSNTLNLNNLISLFTTQNLASPFTAGQAVVSAVNISNSIDLNDTVSLNHISKVGSKGWPILPACSVVTVNNDVWYPNFASTYTCPPSKSRHPACSNLADFTACPQGCYEIWNQIISPSGDPSYATNLNTRYNAGCNYRNYIVNLHDNWNIPRKTKMNQVKSNLDIIKTNLDSYQTEVRAVQANLNSFKTTLQANFNSRINETSGSFYGVDCRVIGQSIYDFRDAICVGLVNSINFNLISLGLICYGILFGACFATCAGVRHFKHLQKMQIHVGYKGVDMTVSENRIFDK